MNILIGVDALEPGCGVPVVVATAVRYLHDQGHDVKVICGRYHPDTTLPVIRCKYNHRLQQADIFDVVRIIKQDPPDIFHSHYFPMDICGALTNSSQMRHVMHSHGTYYVSLRRTAKEMAAAVRAQLGAFLGAHLSSRIVSVSRFLQRELQTKYLVSGKRVETIYNGVDLARFRPDLSGNEIRRRHGITHNDRVLICVASGIPRKGHDLLIQCLGLVTREVRNVNLLLVGVSANSNNPYVRKLVQKVHSLGLQQHVVFCNFVHDKELPLYYAVGDIFVSATKWEGFGLPFAEAMACAKPVIGFDRTAMSELITDGYNGYKVKYRDIGAMAERIIDLCNHLDAARTLGQNGRVFAEKNFDWRTNMARVVEIYQSVLEDR